MLVNDAVENCAEAVGGRPRLFVEVAKELLGTFISHRSGIFWNEGIDLISDIFLREL